MEPNNKVNGFINSINLSQAGDGYVLSVFVKIPLITYPVECKDDASKQKWLNSKEYKEKAKELNQWVSRIALGEIEFEYTNAK